MENFLLVGKCSSKNAKIWAKNHHFGKKIRGRNKISSTLCRKFAAVYRKIAISCPDYTFLSDDAAACDREIDRYTTLDDYVQQRLSAGDKLQDVDCDAFWLWNGHRRTTKRNYTLFIGTVEITDHEQSTVTERSPKESTD